MVAPVSRLEIMLGRTLGGATIASMQGLIVLLISILLGFRVHTLTIIPGVLVFIFLMAILFTALGTAIASILEDIQGFQLIMNFLVMPLFFLSGALFPLQNAPKTLAIIARFDPLSYGVDGLRGLLSGSAHYGVSVDVTILLIVAAIILSIGTYLFSKMQA